ncbi:hypothetical protein GGI19_004699 [Coemansia pectinata]|uniref:Uncharacterized protein n=1 Tax=Coemansia pectinata TaxID=1052879 RepID=A0A9W8GR70_9FUNG|nr:hypothetical protein GGI19_004699 [Coemansia pectinata]
MGMIDVCDGSVLMKLSCEPYKDRTFPKVHSIKFTIFLPAEDMAISPDSESNISAFVQRIKQMAPSIKKVSITQGRRFAITTLISLLLLTSLAEQLSQNVVGVDYDIDGLPVIVVQQMTGLSSLVYSSFTPTDGGKQIMQLARRNASTLQLLKINLNPITVITSLIQNADGSYAQYPCLHTFKLSCQRGSHVSQWPEFPGAVPFPRLRVLNIGMVNPFGDDIVFRGNAATLESLFFPLNTETVRILREGKVFTPVSHPKLQYVNLGMNLDFEPNIFGTDVEYLRFVLRIGSNAPVRTIVDSLTGEAFLSTIPVFGEHTCIQVLTLEYTHLNLCNVIALVKALPLLSDLHTPFPVLGSWPDGVAKHELSAYVIANYAPTGRRFRCWHLLSDHSDHIESAVCCVLLLALVCPNFDYAAVTPTRRGLFMTHMSEMIAVDEFRPHEFRLRRLLFGGAKNEIRSVEQLRR